MESPVEWREAGGSRPHTLASMGDILDAPGNTHTHTEGNYKISRGTKRHTSAYTVEMNQRAELIDDQYSYN